MPCRIIKNHHIRRPRLAGMWALAYILEVRCDAAEEEP